MSVPQSRYVPLATSATLMFVLVFVEAGVATDQVGVSGQRPDLETIVQRLTQAQLENRSRIKAYSLTREYKLFGEDATAPRSEVVATINFLPPNAKSYDIEQSTGGVGERVVRHILDHEVDIARDSRELTVDAQNYGFDLVGEAMLGSHPCYELKITPRHQRKDLLKATMWVDKDSYRILRMEGEPAKSPSFWVKDVHLILNFSEVAGMWMQTETHAIARLRFGGEYKLASHDLTYDVTRELAAGARPVRPRHRHSTAVMAASVD